MTIDAQSGAGGCLALAGGSRAPPGGRANATSKGDSEREERLELSGRNIEVTNLTFKLKYRAAKLLGRRSERAIKVVVVLLDGLLPADASGHVSAERGNETIGHKYINSEGRKERERERAFELAAEAGGYLCQKWAFARPKLAPLAYPWPNLGQVSWLAGA